MSERNWDKREKSQEQVRLKLRKGWRNDDAVLNQYFQSCVSNWKVYKAPRTGKQVTKLQAVYKQALYGDNKELPPLDLESADGLKWIEWNKLRGTPTTVAKRRFITFLSEIDPLLIDVMPDEKPPLGFPVDKNGLPICAKCNTIVGCDRPITDESKIELRKQLFQTPELHEPKRFRLWIKKALETQRCIWGAHIAISEFQAKEFMQWFSKDENRGFYAYDSSPIMFLTRDLVQYYHEVAYEKLLKKKEWEDSDQLAYNKVVTMALDLKQVYQELSGEEFAFDAWCNRDNDLCNQRRKAEGNHNHKHRLDLEPASSMLKNTYDEAIELRKQCQTLGINPSTGLVSDIAERCAIYRKKIADHFEALERAAAAKERNENRPEVHGAEKKKVKQFSKDMIGRQCWDACHLGEADRALVLVRRGCNPNEESPRGITPLICMVLNEASVEQVEELIGPLQANINKVNRFGLTALMYACRIRNSKMLILLLRNGASLMQKGSKAGLGRTALHWCAIHGSEDMVKIAVQHLQESAGDIMRVVRFLDCPSEGEEGETALMLAARRKNSLFCHLLLSFGADPNVRSTRGRTASMIANSLGWNRLSEWLGKKVGAGVAKLETFSDMQFERESRFGYLKMKEQIDEFCTTYLRLIQNRLLKHPLGPPSVAQRLLLESGDKALKEQKQFIDAHHLLITDRSNKYSTANEAIDSSDNAELQKLSTMLTEMVGLLRQGDGVLDPNTELSDSKWLQWTPLMCAVAFNDTRTVKIMLREGADPNHPNRNGTTPVMLAAQLNNLDVLIELIIANGSLTAVDNEGFTPLAYASSLPLPTSLSLNRDCIGTLMPLLDNNGRGKVGATIETAPFIVNSTEIIKMAIKCRDFKELKPFLEKNKFECRPDAIDSHFKFLRLMEQFGLSRVENERSLQAQLTSMHWRVKHSDIEDGKKSSKKAKYFDSEELDEFEREAALRFRSRIEADKKEETAVLRCPVCSLPIPCTHFLKEDSLRDFLEKRDKHKTGKADSSANSNSTVAAVSVASEVAAYAKKMLQTEQNSRQHTVMAETELDDRNTDRSIALVNKYRLRDIAMEKEKEAERQQQLQQEEKRKEELEVAAYHLDEQRRVQREKDQRKQELLDLVTEFNTHVPKQQGDVSSAIPMDNKTDLPIVTETASDTIAPVISISDTTGEAIVGTTDTIIEKPMIPAENQDSAIRNTTATDGQIVIVEERDFARGEVSIKSAIKKISSYDASGKTDVIDDKQSKKNKKARAARRVQFSLSTDDPVLAPITETAAAVDPTKLIEGIQDPSIDKEKDNGIGEGSDTRSAVDNNVISFSEKRKKDYFTNPLPKNKRKMFLFTEDPAERFDLTRPLKGEDSITTSTGTSTSTNDPVDDVSNLRLKVSGNIFVHLSEKLVNIPQPVEVTSIKLSAWASIVENMKSFFLADILPNVLLQPLIDAKTWKSIAPRCQLCLVGFVRFADTIHEFKENFDCDAAAYLGKYAYPECTKEVDTKRLCMPCLLRKVLFDKIVLTFPRSTRMTHRDLKWPFSASSTTVTESIIDENVDKEPTNGIATSPLRILPPLMSPTTSSELLLLDSSEMTDEDFMTSIDRTSSSSSRKLLSGANSRTQPNLAVAVATSADGKSKPKKGRDNKKDLLDTTKDFTNAAQKSSVYSKSAKSIQLQPIAAALVASPNSFGNLSRRDSSSSLGSAEDMSVSSTYRNSSGNSRSSIGVNAVAVAVAQTKKDRDGQPEELALLPYLVCKGNFLDAERMIRIAVGKQAVDEGAGLKRLLLLMEFQAEMYKLMGLWPLSIGIYLDCADLTAALLGFSDSASLTAWGLVANNLRKMHLDYLASFYLKSLLEDIEKQTLKKMRTEITASIQEQDKLGVQLIASHRAIWTDRILPTLPANSTYHRLSNTVGIGALFQLFSAQDGYLMVSRGLFISYCHRISSNILRRIRVTKQGNLTESGGYGEFAEFIDSCFRLRNCDQKHVFRQTLQHIMQKQISRNLITSSRLARTYQSLLQRGNNGERGIEEDQLVNFIRFGEKLDVLSHLDGLLQVALTELAPIYRDFALRSSEGSLLREVDDGALSAYAMDAAAVTIQCLWRRQKARVRVQQRREVVLKEKQRQLAEEEVQRQRQSHRHRRG